ncbi:MAG TPA: hypothetical protein P5333_15440, partial [Caldilinea sp.]|nr:hypothetical protein [Caldilinea sp.]
PPKVRAVCLTNSPIPGIPTYMQWFTIERKLGTPRIAGFHTITGEALAVQMRWPGGGFVWNTPVAVHVQRRGHTVVHPVRDLTRIAQFAVAIVTVMLVLSLRQEGKRDSP